MHHSGKDHRHSSAGGFVRLRDPVPDIPVWTTSFPLLAGLQGTHLTSLLATNMPLKYLSARLASDFSFLRRERYSFIHNVFIYAQDTRHCATYRAFFSSIIKMPNIVSNQKCYYLKTTLCLQGSSLSSLMVVGSKIKEVSKSESNPRLGKQAKIFIRVEEN